MYVYFTGRVKDSSISRLTGEQRECACIYTDKAASSVRQQQEPTEDACLCGTECGNTHAHRLILQPKGRTHKLVLTRIDGKCRSTEE